MNGPVGIITGGLSGIGAATTLEFARLGASLVLADVDTVRRTADHQGGGARRDGDGGRVDVTDYQAVERLVERTTADFGRLDFLVANAGIAEQSRIATGDPERWAAVVQTNLLGTMHTVRAALPVMRRQGEGHILIVASTSGREPYVGEPSYLASKFGVVGFRVCVAAGVRRVRSAHHDDRARHGGHAVDARPCLCPGSARADPPADDRRTLLARCVRLSSSRRMC